jgi:hypothetical protein
MKSNETSFRHSHKPRTVYQKNHKIQGTGAELRASNELSARGERRKLAAEQRRLQRKQKRLDAKTRNEEDSPSPN